MIGVEHYESSLVRDAVSRLTGLFYEEKEIHVEPSSTHVSNTLTPRPAVVQKSIAFTVPPDFELKGKMTIAEIAKTLGTTEEAVIQKLGLDPKIPKDSPLKDLSENYNFTMSDIKEKIKE